MESGVKAEETVSPLNGIKRKSFGRPSSAGVLCLYGPHVARDEPPERVLGRPAHESVRPATADAHSPSPSAPDPPAPPRELSPVVARQRRAGPARFKRLSRWPSVVLDCIDPERALPAEPLGQRGPHDRSLDESQARQASRAQLWREQGPKSTRTRGSVGPLRLLRLARCRGRRAWDRGKAGQEGARRSSRVHRLYDLSVRLLI